THCSNSARARATMLARSFIGLLILRSIFVVTHSKKKGGGSRLPLFRGLDQAREALACSAIFVNAALSCTARSASTLRSMSIEAFLRPFMNALYVMPASRTRSEEHTSE